MVELGVSIPIAIMLLWPNHTQASGIVVAPVANAGGAYSNRIGILLLIIIILVIVGALGAVEVSGATVPDSTIEEARREPGRRVPGNVDSLPQTKVSMQGLVVTGQCPQRYTGDRVPIISEGAREITIIWSSIDPPQSGVTIQAICWKDGAMCGQLDFAWPDGRVLTMSAEALCVQYSNRGLHRIAIQYQGETIGEVEYMVTQAA